MSNVMPNFEPAYTDDAAPVEAGDTIQHPKWANAGDHRFDQATQGDMGFGPEPTSTATVPPGLFTDGE